MNGEKSVCHELRVLNHMIKRRADAAIAAELGGEVTEMQGCVIGFLHHNRGRKICQKDVETQFCITRATTSKMLTLMEKNGLVTRSAVRDDARLKRLELTERAENIARQVECGLDELEARVMGDMTAEERETLLRLLGRLQENVQMLEQEEGGV